MFHQNQRVFFPIDWLQPIGGLIVQRGFSENWWYPKRMPCYTEKMMILLMTLILVLLCFFKRTKTSHVMMLICHWKPSADWWNPFILWLYWSQWSHRNRTVSLFMEFMVGFVPLLMVNFMNILNSSKFYGCFTSSFIQMIDDVSH